MDARAQESFQVSLLGPLRAWRQEAELPLGPPQQRAVLALLLLRRGRAVALGELVDGIWGADPPAAAVSVLRTYVSRLRKLLEPGRPADEAPRLLVSLGDGYALRSDAVLSDLDRFEDLVERAGALRAEGADRAAVDLLRDADALWEGVPLTGLPGPRIEAERGHLEERRLAALETRLRIELDLGEHARVLPELTALCAAHPLREALCELRIIALYRGGRRAEALDVYARTRRLLVEELGIEPGPSLRALHADLLADDAGPAARPASADAGHGSASGAEPDGPPGPGGIVRPSQLPADLVTFAGRRAELDCAAALLPDRGHPQTPLLGLVSGMAGAGKTTLVVHWAHQMAHRFPDGSLYVNLRGHDPSGSRMDPREALERFLVALGVAPQAIPEGLDAQAALYRGVLAGRRLLIVLDNAADTEQVEPLLPAAPGCFVVVTSRSRLSGLVARHGAHPLTLGVLSCGESLELLARRLGAARVDAEPEAARAIVELCARLPLALSIVAARAALHPGFRLADIAAELRKDHGSLDAFAGDDVGTDVRAVFSWSYQALSPQAARLFRRLALHPGPDVTHAAAAALAGVPPRQVRALLTELTGASLLTERAPGRFVLHDLLRAYAAERTEAEDGPPESAAALLRLHSHFLFTAHNAATALDPFREAMPLPPCPPDAAPLRFGDRAQAAAWLRTERYVLREIVGHAAAHGYHTHAWLTAAALNVYFNRLGYWHDLLEIEGTALRSARAAGSAIGQAYALCGLGGAHSQLNHPEQALRHLEDALRLFRSACHPMGQALVHRGLAYLSNRGGRPQDALDHYARAIELYRSEGNVSGEAGVLNQVAWTYILIDEHEKALLRCEEAIAHCQELGDPYGEASTQDTLGYALYHLRRYPQAIERFERSQRLFHEIGDRFLESDVLRHLGAAHRATGDLGAAREALTAALALLEEGGHTEADEVRRELSELSGPNGGNAPSG
ncbi:AfsR/SARP family transcriptional regulator [Streptomyces fumanus]|uniref:SARP family transcriptional regulator n=1 Tax=Streptomyces fumanus TaxID=67302 RepID=A0A919A359_9ACTN|nr:BTAD domain-containing putative transcriptional regulator [Streptomyces fumanus]GHE85352.1 SARP family transcriptional regulator [Streptomyces fumanus]